MDEATHGLAGWFTCWQFDRAVMVFGRWVDGKLKQTDEKGRALHDLDDLLSKRKVERWSPGQTLLPPLKHKQ